MDITLAIIILVGIIYLLIIIGAIFFIRYKKSGMFKQTIDPKPHQDFDSDKKKVNE